MKEKFPEGGFCRITLDYQPMGAYDYATPTGFYDLFKEGFFRTRLVFPESFNCKGEFDGKIVGGKVEYISRLKRTRENNKKDQLN